MIAKTATNAGRFKRAMLPFPSARAAFAAYLRSLDLTPDQEVLLPAYIGWSAREGSGVFDPIRETGVTYRFYRMNRDLTIDIEDLAFKLAEGKAKLVVAIHYFGWPDPNMEEVAGLAQDFGALLLEDEAHALFSDLVGGVCGRFGDASIYSLHKMLPFPDGGLLAFNGPARAIAGSTPTHNAFDYDLLAIAHTRRTNAEQLLAALAPLAGKVDPLWPEIPEGVVPQTLPVIIQQANRDQLYQQMNDANFGVVSLYHTMIDVLTAEAFPDSHWLARHVMNLPVHQDVDPAHLDPMLQALAALVA